MLNGSGEDHAVLLHNFLCALDYEAYLMLGSAVPEGETAYVVCKNKQDDHYVAINPTTGRTTDVNDSKSSMQQLRAVVNRENVHIFISRIDTTTV